MHRFAHTRIVELAAEVLPKSAQKAVGALWEGIETGATLPDELHFVWDTDEQQGVVNRVLMHRCYVDSDEPRDRGCPIQIVRYATGIPDFVHLYARGKLEGVYDEEEFLLNTGSYFGVVAHHIADLHTPVHVGRNLDLTATGYSKASGFHSRVEADLDRAARRLTTIRPYAPEPVQLTTAAFEDMAERTYSLFFSKLPRVYATKSNVEARLDWLETCITEAAKRTADVWTVLFAIIGPEATAAISR